MEFTSSHLHGVGPLNLYVDLQRTIMDASARFHVDLNSFGITNDYEKISSDKICRLLKNFVSCL